MSTPNFHGWTDEKAAERFALQREVNNALVWAAEQTLANENWKLPDDLGTLFIISGGEALELDTHLESRYEELTDEMPF